MIMTEAVLFSISLIFRFLGVFLTKLLTLGILLSITVTTIVVAVLGYIKVSCIRYFVFNLIYFSIKSSSRR